MEITIFNGTSPYKRAILHSYIKLPEGTPHMNFFPRDWWTPTQVNPWFARLDLSQLLSSCCQRRYGIPGCAGGEVLSRL